MAYEQARQIINRMQSFPHAWKRSLRETLTQVYSDIDTGIVEFDAGLTAGTTQTQAGGLKLTASFNEVSVVGTEGDAVVLPEAVEGALVEVTNSATNHLQVFPAVGDDIGRGLNLSIILEDNDTIVLRAKNAVTWIIVSGALNHAGMLDEDNTDVFVVNDAGGDLQSYHSGDLAGSELHGWAFDAGGAGTSFPIASIGAGVIEGHIKVTTTGDHGLAVGDIISQTNLANAAYVGIFVVAFVYPDDVSYEVEAVFTATGTGTMDQAATLTCGAGASGFYNLDFHASATTASNNETFDFEVCLGAVAVAGSKVRRRFGTAADFGSFTAGGFIHCQEGDKVSLAMANQDSAGNITIRNFHVGLTQL